MAILGAQIIVTMTMLSILHKLSLRYSIAKRVLTKLVRYLHPKTEQIKLSANLQSSTHSSNANSQNNSNNSKFRKGGKNKHEHNSHSSHSNSNNNSNGLLVPKNIDITLEAEKIKEIDLLQLQYYTEYQWLLDFAFTAFIVYMLTEFYYFLSPSTQDFNLSLIWCILVIVFCLKILVSLTTLYFRGGDEAMGERSICITAASLYFLLSMIVLIINENFLEFGLDAAYSSFNESAYHLLEAHDMLETATGPTSKLIFKLCLAIWSGVIGALFIFPGIRFAQMHRDALLYSKGRHFLQIMLHLSFISPLFICLLWIKPLARNYFTEKNWSSRGILMTSENFDTMRIMFTIAVATLRFILMPKYLQAYLNLAPRKLSNIKKETGRINSVDLQKMVAHVFYYLCVVCLQYIGPILLCLTTALLFKTLGEYNWLNLSSLKNNYPQPMSPAYFNSATEFNLQLLRQIFSSTLYRGLLGYMTWWMSMVLFSSSIIGYVHHSYFSS